MDDQKFSLDNVLSRYCSVTSRPPSEGASLLYYRAVRDSRKVQPGDIFVAVRGPSSDGHQYIRQAAEYGAKAIVAESPAAEISIPQWIVSDSRKAWGGLCMAMSGFPAADIRVTGITGTNGKTTSTWLLRNILKAAGRSCGLLGTIEYHNGTQSAPSDLTTPDAYHQACFLAELRQQGIGHCVMEISSHALDQQRCSALQLDAAALTNITQDHFDYHRSADRYRRAKLQIADLLTEGRPLLLGIDDPGCRLALCELPKDVNTMTFGFSADAQMRAVSVTGSTSGTVMTLRLMHNEITATTPLIGRHNVLNCLTAAGIAEQLGITPEAITEGLESLHSVPGRLERIDEGQSFAVYVDYAHTPDGLEHCLRTVRELTTKRVICVFGAGGDRDRRKRPLMARAAAAADMIIVTSDNPRTEDPDRIIDEIAAGLKKDHQLFRCTDRSEAIRMAVHMALPGDCLVVAGRGHETEQQSAGRRVPFDDRMVVRRHLQQLPGADEWLRTQLISH